MPFFGLKSAHLEKNPRIHLEEVEKVKFFFKKLKSQIACVHEWSSLAPPMVINARFLVHSTQHKSCDPSLKACLTCLHLGRGARISVRNRRCTYRALPARRGCLTRLRPVRETRINTRNHCCTNRALPARESVSHACNWDMGWLRSSLKASRRIKNGINHPEGLAPEMSPV